MIKDDLKHFKKEQKNILCKKEFNIWDKEKKSTMSGIKRMMDTGNK